MILNRAGYDLLAEEKFNAAIELFRINTGLFPQIANTWDSLGEACMRSGDKKAAIMYYKKTLKLDPDNMNAREILKRLEN